MTYCYSMTCSFKICHAVCLLALHWFLWCYRATVVEAGFIDTVVLSSSLLPSNLFLFYLITWNHSNQAPPHLTFYTTLCSYSVTCNLIFTLSGDLRRLSKNEDAGEDEMAELNTHCPVPSAHSFKYIAALQSTIGSGRHKVRSAHTLFPLFFETNSGNLILTFTTLLWT